MSIKNKLISTKLVEGSVYEENSRLYMKLSLDKEYSDGSIERMVFPKIEMNLDLSDEFVVEGILISEYLSTQNEDGVMRRKYLLLPADYIDLPNGSQRLYACSARCVIKPATAKEMTLEEIEKELGYKVKIVEADKEEVSEPKIVNRYPLDEPCNTCKYWACFSHNFYPCNKCDELDEFDMYKPLSYQDIGYPTCGDCTQCRYDETEDKYFCRRSYTSVSSESSACDDFELDDC